MTKDRTVNQWKAKRKTIGLFLTNHALFARATAQIVCAITANKNYRGVGLAVTAVRLGSISPYHGACAKIAVLCHRTLITATPHLSTASQ